MHCTHSYQHALYTFPSTCIVRIRINLHCTHSYQQALYTFPSTSSTHSHQGENTSLTCIVHIFTTCNFVTSSFVCSLIYCHCQFEPHFQKQKALNKPSFFFFFLIINTYIFSDQDQSSPGTGWRQSGQSYRVGDGHTQTSARVNGRSRPGGTCTSHTSHTPPLRFLWPRLPAEKGVQCMMGRKAFPFLRDRDAFFKIFFRCYCFDTKKGGKSGPSQKRKECPRLPSWQHLLTLSLCDFLLAFLGFHASVCVCLHACVRSRRNHWMCVYTGWWRGGEGTKGSYWHALSSL